MKQIDSHFPVRVLLLIAYIGFFCVLPVSAQFNINENFKGSSAGSDIILGGNPSAYLTSGRDGDDVGDGWLRLTTDANDQRGYAYINIPFPSTLGAVIDFEYKSWRRNVSGNIGADGFSVFLFDGSVTPTDFRIGAYGGSLGYAPSNLNNTNTPGLFKAYLGIGFDEYGNFANASEGKHGGTNGNSPNSIVLRGPANHAQPYRYLKHNQLQTSGTTDGVNSVDYNKNRTSRPNDETFYRRVKIYIEPIGTISAPRYKIRVLWRTSVNGTEIELISHETTDSMPTTLKLGFGASTGGDINYHEIRNLIITTPGGVRVQKNVDKPNVETGHELTYTLEVYNEMDVPITNLKLDDVVQLANGITAPVNDFEITSITFNNNGNSGNTAIGFPSGTAVTTGLTNPFTTTLEMADKGMATFTVKGNVKRVPEGGTLTNTVKIDPSNATIKGTSTKIVDYDLANNQASVTSSIISGPLDLRIEKRVDNNGIASQSDNTFTIIVSNMSTTEKQAGTSRTPRHVTVTDTIPAGLTVIGWSGEGWTRDSDNNGQVQRFLRNDKLDPLGAYPPITITVRPATSGDNIGPWVNRAWVTVQNVVDSNSENNVSSAEMRWKNYWIGTTTSTDWRTASNWTTRTVPSKGEDIEFATAANNGGSNGMGTGPAKNDLHLDNQNQDNSGGRIIGNLINNSDKNLVITTGYQLTINGTVTDENAEAGTIVVKSSPDAPTGTLKFADPARNKNVKATVEFYNQAFECTTCGFYKNNWQYFGVPVQEAAFPYLIGEQTEIVNQWVEPFNGNKWRLAPYAPDTKLKAFKGYEITRKSQVAPSVSSPNNALYSFSGDLNTEDATVAITRTLNVNYTGANLVANSYTAAIPIRADKAGLEFPAGFDRTVYLFNTGTRDQWRKLDGTSITTNNYRSGQYLAVPVNQGGQGNLPDKIPSMHAFMVLYPNNNPPPVTNLTANLVVKYDKLEKNTKVNRGDGTQITTRSAGSGDKTSESGSTASNTPLPVLIMDVIGEQSADRLWIFTKTGTTHGFDNGWDGRKMEESGIAQLYVTGTDDSKLQVATVPEMNNVRLGFVAEADGRYTFNFSLQGTLKGSDLFLYDAVTGRSTLINDGGGYTFEAKQGENVSRFRLAYTGNNKFLSTDEALIEVLVTEAGKIKVVNGSGSVCSVFVSGASGAHSQRVEAAAGSETEITVPGNGTYMVRLQNAVVNDVRRVIVK